MHPEAVLFDQAVRRVGRELRLNLSAHKTPRVEQFFAAHPKVHLHYTPTYSSWLNQVEIWFADFDSW